MARATRPADPGIPLQHHVRSGACAEPAPTGPSAHDGTALPLKTRRSHGCEAAPHGSGRRGSPPRRSTPDTRPSSPARPRCRLSILYPEIIYMVQRSEMCPEIIFSIQVSGLLKNSTSSVRLAMCSPLLVCPDIIHLPAVTVSEPQENV